MSLQAQIRCMKRVIGDYERLEAARRFDALVQVAAEEDEKQILPESIVLEAGPSVQAPLRRSRRKRHFG